MRATELFRNPGEGIRHLREHRLFRYGLSGGATLVVNILAEWFFIEIAGLRDTALERGISHFLGAVISILFSYFAHRTFTWRDRKTAGSMAGQLTQYYIFTGFTLGLRQISFSLLDAASFHWFISTIIPMIIVIIMNFLGYDKMIFRTARQ